MANPILLYRSIWEDTAEDITNQIFNYPEDEEVKIWMNSPGGMVTAGWALIGALKDRDKGFSTKIMGDASSMAFNMLLFSNYNEALDSSNFLIHRAASYWEDIMTNEEKKDIEDRNKVIRKKMSQRINEDKFIEVTGKSFDDIFDMTQRLDVRLNAQQAKKIGLVDKIIKLDTKKLEAIESRFFYDVAALSENQEIKSSINIKSKKMGLKDLFKSKDPLLTATIDGTRFVYDELKMDEVVKPLDNAEAVNGSFEANNKKITVKDNKIVAVEEVDYRGLITALEAKVKVMEENSVTAQEVADVLIEQLSERDKRIEALEGALEKAKLSVSNPKIPEAKFENEPTGEAPTGKDKDRKIQKSIEAKQAEIAEAVKKQQNNRRL